MDEQQQKKRYKNSIDTFSLQNEDGTVLSAEEIAIGEIGFANMLAQFTTDRQRFIALALYQGWKKGEIAKILRVSPGDIGHIIRRMQIKLTTYRITYRHK